MFVIVDTDLNHAGLLNKTEDGWRVHSFSPKGSSRKGHAWASKALPKKFSGYLVDTPKENDAIPLARNYVAGCAIGAEAMEKGKLFIVLDGIIARTPQAVEAGMFVTPKGAK